MFTISPATKLAFSMLFSLISISLAVGDAHAQSIREQCPTGKEFQIWASASSGSIKTAVDKALISAKRKARVTCGEFEDDSIKKVGKVVAKVTKVTRVTKQEVKKQSGRSKPSYEAIVDPYFCCIGASENEVETASNSISELRALPNVESSS